MLIGVSHAQDEATANSISLAWENDIFNGHDYYYSNGIRLDLYHSCFPNFFRGKFSIN
jgi:hypothetical protein